MEGGLRHRRQSREGLLKFVLRHRARARHDLGKIDVAPIGIGTASTIAHPSLTVVPDRRVHFEGAVVHLASFYPFPSLCRFCALLDLFLLAKNLRVAARRDAGLGASPFLRIMAADEQMFGADQQSWAREQSD